MLDMLIDLTRPNATNRTALHGCNNCVLNYKIQIYKFWPNIVKFKASELKLNMAGIVPFYFIYCHIPRMLMC